VIVALLVAQVARASEAPIPDGHPPQPRNATVAFRTGIPAGPPTLTSRIAGVEDFDGPFIGELTLRAQGGWRWFGMGAELAGTAGASEIWSGAGVGNLVVDARFIFGGSVTSALGLRSTFAVGNRYGPRGPVAWWGTVPWATIPAAGVALAWEGATPRWVWHAHVGFSLPLTPFVTGYDLGASVATVQPIGGRFSIVAEAEAFLMPSPLHARVLVRRQLGEHWTVDAGLAVPVPVFFVDPTLQVIASVRAGL
jgi:hypothetical protein